MALLSIRNLHKQYGNVTAIQSLDLDLEKGEVIVLLGPSGCGKSTLLRCVNGLEPHQGGSIVMDGVGEFGKDVSWQTARQKVGMVFQSYELFAHMTVIENILLGPVKVQNRNRAEAEAQADKLLERVGLLDRKNAYPRELSGGQKQRIAIVRALCLNPEVILLDEITAALDPEMVREVLEVVLELAREGMSMLIVTHEMGFARKVADRIVFMDKGGIVESTDPETFFSAPKSEILFSGRPTLFQTASTFNQTFEKETLMQLNAKFKALLASAAIAVGLTACGGGSGDAQSSQSSGAATVAAIKEKGVIRIGVFGDKPPFGYVDANGKNQGFDVEIAKDLAKDLLGSPDKVEFVLTEAANRVEYVRSGKVDLILANFTKTPERAEAVDFADPYMKVALGVVSPKDKPITDVAQLKDQTLLVNKGTTADAFFTKSHPEVKLLKFDQNTETFDALKDGRGVALAHDNALLWAWAKENPNFEVAIGNLGPAEFIAPAVQKGNTDLLNWVNGEIAAMKKDGRLKAAYEKTLLPVYGEKVKPEELLAE